MSRASLARVTVGGTKKRMHNGTETANITHGPASKAAITNAVK
jgi:hypothetical protein